MATAMAMVMMRTNGTPAAKRESGSTVSIQGIGMLPDPRLPRNASKISVRRPSAMTRAMPRPATSMPRVATMGWMPTCATSVPLTAPRRAPARRAMTMAGMGPSHRVAAIVAAATAITEPREMSMPRVPMTSARPSETIATGTTWMSWSRRFG